MRRPPESRHLRSPVATGVDQWREDRGRGQPRARARVCGGRRRWSRMDPTQENTRPKQCPLRRRDSEHHWGLVGRRCRIGWTVRPIAAGGGTSERLPHGRHSRCWWFLKTCRAKFLAWVPKTGNGGDVGVEERSEVGGFVRLVEVILPQWRICPRRGKRAQQIVGRCLRIAASFQPAQPEIKKIGDTVCRGSIPGDGRFHNESHP